MTDLIAVERTGDVATLTMAHGRANTMDTDLCRAITQTLHQLEADPTCRAAVLTGTGSVFSAGADLVAVLEGGTTYLETFLPALSDALDTLFRFPKPLVAAVNGHAIAGGCVVAAACDRRFMALGRARIGVPELVVGVSYPLVGLEILRFATAGRNLAELMYTGATLDAEDAVRRGLIDVAVEGDELPALAMTAAQSLARMPTESFRTTKDQLRRPFLHRIESDRHLRDAETMATWTSAEVCAAMQAYVDATLTKRPG